MLNVPSEYETVYFHPISSSQKLLLHFYEEGGRIASFIQYVAYVVTKGGAETFLKNELRPWQFHIVGECLPVPESRGSWAKGKGEGKSVRSRKPTLSLLPLSIQVHLHTLFKYRRLTAGGFNTSEFRLKMNNKGILLLNIESNLGISIK